MNYATLILFVALSLAAGLVGAWFEPGLWYALMNKPWWTPPDAVFAPVWTLLYVVMGTSAWLAWRRSGWSGAHWLFVLQLVLNAGWSWLFFGLHRTGWALAEIGLLWLVILAVTVGFWRIRREAGLILLPYLAWVAFAAALNFRLWQLNGGGLPFG